MKSVTTLLVIVILGTALYSTAQNPVPSGFQAITATWKASPVTTSCGGFTDAIGRSWADPLFDDSGWSTINPPDAGSFNTSGLSPSDRFYRGLFSVSSTAQPVFLFFVSDDSIEIFVNGASVGSFGPFAPSTCHQLGCVNIPGCGPGFDVDPAPVQIPANLLRQGLNIIAAHVSNGGGGSFFDLKVLTNGSLASPAIGISETSVDFGRQPVGLPSAPQTLFIINTGGGILVPSFTMLGDYSQTNNCSTGLVSGASCQVNLAYTPTALGNEAGSLSITAAGVSKAAQVILTGFGGLRFPLKGSERDSDAGFTPYNAGVNSVFDHSMSDSKGGFSIYGCDKAVTNFAGEVADQLPTEKIARCQKGYSQPNKVPFEANINYSGTILFYDGHPGYDFQSLFGNQVYAATSGTVKYPTLYDLQASHITIGGDPDDFQVLEVDAADDLKIFYLHLATHPRAISFHLVTSRTGQNFVANADSRFSSTLQPMMGIALGSLSISGTIAFQGSPFTGVAVQLFGRTINGDCIAEVAVTDGTGGYEFDGLEEGFYNLRAVRSGFSFAAQVQNADTPAEGSHVSAGDLIGDSGNAGACGGRFGVPAHLHFEVQRKTSAQVTDHGAGGPIKLDYIPVDPYGWEPFTPDAADPYFQIPDLQGSGLSNENLWELIPGIPQLVDVFRSQTIIDLREAVGFIASQPIRRSDFGVATQ